MVVAEGLFQLAEQAGRLGWPAWSVKLKYHMMEEMFQYQAYECGNLDNYNEYLDEDFVGQVAKLA